MSDGSPLHNQYQERPPSNLQFADIENGAVNFEALTPEEYAAAKLALLVSSITDRYCEDIAENEPLNVILRRTVAPDFTLPDAVSISEEDLGGFSSYLYRIVLHYPLSDPVEVSATLRYETLDDPDHGEEHIVTEVVLENSYYALEDIEDPLEREKFLAAFSGGVDSLERLLQGGDYESIPEAD